MLPPSNVSEWQTTPLPLSIPETVVSDEVVPSQTPDHVVAIIHGIRDLGLWSNRLQAETRTEEQRFGQTIQLCPISIGWLDPITFILRIRSKAREARVLEQLSYIYNKYPAANHSIVAHSYGTDMLARVLIKSPVKTYRYVFLCGGVCKEDPFSYIFEQKAENVIIDCSTKDIFPALAHGLNPFFYEYTGSFGFRCTRALDRFWERGHGFYNTEEHFFENVVPMIIGRPIVHGVNPSSKLFARLPQICHIILALGFGWIILTKLL